MRYLLIILLVVVASCSKQGQCYECSFGTVNGYTPPTEKYCGPMPYEKRINGVPVNTFCVPK